MKSAMSACALVELVRHARGTEWRFSEACATRDEAPALAAQTSAACTPEARAVDALAPAPTTAPVCAAASSSKASATTPACAAAGSSGESNDLHFDERPTDGLCVGTLRWSGDGSFPPLAPVPAPLAAATKSEVLGLLGGGWRDYIEARIPPDATGDIRVEAPLLDGLSYPLSLVRALATLNFRAPKPGPLNILVIGASSKAEERLWRCSNYWDELGVFLRGTEIALTFVGPEISAESAAAPRATRGRISAGAYRGTLGELLQNSPGRYGPADTIVAAFNTGMGSGLWPLMKSWIGDLVLLLQRGYVAVFTCANDYSDLRGEMLVHQLLGSNVVLAPSKNPFKAATIVHQPASELQRSNKKGKKGRGAKGGAGNDSGRQPEWSCSSCYVYAVQGSDPDAAALPAPESAARGELLAVLGGKLRKLAERLRETETPSPMP